MVGPKGLKSNAVTAGRLAGLAALCLGLFGLTGCTTVLSPISGIPAHRLPDQFLAEPRANLKPIDLSRLRQDPPEEYLLDAKDLLGIYIQGILGEEEQPPPVNFPDSPTLPPALGYPIPVRDDGTIALPLIPPINVRGMTLAQAQDVILREYTKRELLKDPRVIVTLIRRRTYQVVVIREDSGAQGQRFAQNQQGVGRFFVGSVRRGTGQTVNLPAYENDVLRALAATGGLPGLDAKSEVKILRGKFANAAERDAFLQRYLSRQPDDPCLCPPDPPDDPTIIRIPLRLPPGQVPDVEQSDIILQDGDIVYIESRETEVYYTGGLLPGGEHPLPRDFDLDILAAIARAGGSLTQNVGVGVINVQGGGVAPTQALVIRKLPCNQSIVIEVDLTRAITDTRERLLIQPGDTIILRYRPVEEFTNFALATFFLEGVRRLFNN